MDRLTEQQAGNRATAKWANEVVDELRRQHLIPGNGIRITTNSNGTRIDIDIPAEASSSATPDPAIDSCFPVFIMGYYPNQTYKGAQYKIVGKQYSTDSRTESDRLYFPHVTPQTRVPMGCTILAHRVAAPLIESSND